MTATAAAGGLLQAVPVPVWEQLGLVVIVLSVLIPGMFAAIRWILNDQRKAQLESQQALLKQQQDFIESRDSNWQEFLERQAAAEREIRDEDRKQIAELAQFIKLLTGEVSGLAREFAEHVADETARFDVLLTDTQKARVKEQVTQPRKR